jgi:hypothetical protein
LDLASIAIDQIADDHGLEATHVNFSIVALLDVGKVGGIAAAVIRMAIRAARTGECSALAFGHADTVHVKIGDLFGHALGFIGGDGQAGKDEREDEKNGNT